MKKDEQVIESITLQDFLQALEDALYEATSTWEPIGFLPCPLVQQLVHEADINDSIWEMVHESLTVAVVPDDDVSHLS